MKQLLFGFIFVGFSLTSSGQRHDYNKGCNVVQLLAKQNVDSIFTPTPAYHPNGFYLVTNQVYDFIIDGKKNFYSLLLNVESDSFTIATKWESGEKEDKIIDSMKVFPNQQIQIRMLTINNGRGGLPFKTKVADYEISIVSAEKYCFAKFTPVVSKGKEFMSHQYFTQYPNKNIRVVGDKAWFIDERGEFPLAKK